MISAGCTSSTDALGYAFNMIRLGLADHIVTGGTDATITPAVMQGFCVMQVVTRSRNDEPAKASRPFDRYIPNSSVTKSVDVSLCNCIGFGSKNSALVIERGDIP